MAGPGIVAPRRTRRGAPPKISIERKNAALAVKDAGGSYKDAAKELYDTSYPTVQQVKNASKHIASHRVKQQNPEADLTTPTPTE